MVGNDEVEVLDAEDVAAISEDGYITPKEMREQCGFNSDQMVRFWSNTFQEYLHLSHTEKGHRRYAKRDINLLIRIRQLCQDEKRPVAEVKEILNNEGYTPAVMPVEISEKELTLGGMNSAEQVQVIFDALERMMNTSEKKIKNTIRDSFKQSKSLMEESAKQQEEQAKLIQTQAKAIQKQNELIEKQQSEIDEMKKTLEEIREQTKKKKTFWKK